MPSGLTRESAMTTGGWSCFEDVAAGPIRIYVFRPFITSAFAECVVCGWPKREGNFLSSFFPHSPRDWLLRRPSLPCEKLP